MSEFNLTELQDLSKKIRKSIVRMATNGGAFVGASLSCVELTAYLYTNHLNVNPELFDNPERDYFFLSKGHVVPVIYSTFAELGWLDKNRLNNHLKTNDDIYWHPNRNVKGIEFHSGSLGHSLSIALGVAKDIKIRGGKNKVVVMMGDGELNEGSNWESILVASAFNLDNLTLIVDRNQFQANITTEELIPIEPLEDKFSAFGMIPRRINGHDLNQIHDALSNLPQNTGKPNVVIADTIRGKGIPSIEARSDKWFVNFDEKGMNEALSEIEAQ